MSPLGYALVNSSTQVQQDDLVRIAAALAKQFARDFCPMWGLSPLPVQAFGADDLVPDGWWWLNIVDAVDDPGSLGYHTDEDGRVFAEVEVSAVLKAGGGVLEGVPGVCADSVSSVISHELLEMTVNPTVDLFVADYAKEVADPVQNSCYAIDGVQVSNFVLPSWFTRDNDPGSRFDVLGILSAPFSIAAGGYVTMKRNGVTETLLGALAHAMPQSRRRKAVVAGGLRPKCKAVDCDNRVAPGYELCHTCCDRLNAMITRMVGASIGPSKA